MLTPEEVKNIAKLSRIAITDAEVEKFQKQLSAVLDYVEELNKVDTEGVSEVFEVTGLANVQRDDKAAEAANREDILKNAPEIKDGYYKVKAIL